MRESPFFCISPFSFALLVARQSQDAYEWTVYVCVCRIADIHDVSHFLVVFLKATL